MRSTRALGAVIAAMVAALVAPSQIAHATILQTLINNPTESVISGDKEFDNFSVTITGIPNFVADPTQIDVVPIYDAVRDEYGIQFRSLDPGNPVPIISAEANAYVDVLIGFDVAVTRPGWFIHDITLKMVASAPVDGAAQVVETALKGPQVVGQAQVQTLSLPMEDHMDLIPGDYTKLWILKDIVAIGGTTDRTVIWTIDQTFSQTPEPATLALLSLGGIVAFRRRRALRRFMPQVAILILAVGLVALQPGTASAYTLQELDDGQSVLYGDKLFHNFDVGVVSSGRVFADPNNIEVVGITINGEHGLQFGGLIGALATPAGPATVTMQIDFDVTVQAPHLWIHDASLSFNGAVTDPVSGATDILEIVTGGPRPLYVAAPGGPLSLSDHVELDAIYKTIHVTKVISLDAGMGLTTISFIQQTFSQVVPEPGTLALLGLGLPVLLRRRRGR